MKIKDKLSQETWNLIDSIIVAIAVFIAFTLCTMLSSCAQEKSYVTIDKEEYEYLKFMEEKANKLENLSIIVHDLLYRVWVDRPSYVKDVLIDTDEFRALLEAEDPDTSDIFEFYDVKDSIEYEANKNI